MLRLIAEAAAHSWPRRGHTLRAASGTRIDSPPWGRVRPFPAVTRIRRIPLRATGGVAAPEPVADATPLLGAEWPGWGLPGVGVVERESTAGVELWLFPESRPLSLNSARWNTVTSDEAVVGCHNE